MAFEERRRPARPRDPDTRARDHAQIDRLTDDLLPDLIDRLATSGLGELEVREDDWRIRLRLPGGTPAPTPRGDAARTADRQARPSGGRQGGASPTATQSATATPAAAASASPAAAREVRSNGTGPSAVGPHRVIAISPAVGIFQPRPELRTGARVRQGDRLGAVDLLGVPQEVVAPEDGIVVDTLAESGEGVEYGQDLVVIEPARSRSGADPLATSPVTES